MSAITLPRNDPSFFSRKAKVALGFLLFIHAAGSHSFAQRAESFFGVCAARLEHINDLQANLEPDCLAEIDRLSADYPDSPIPPILRLNYLYWQQFYVAYQPQLNRDFKGSAMSLLEQLSEGTAESSDQLAKRFATAYAKGLLGKFYFENGRPLRAAKIASGAVHDFERLIEIQSDCSEAKLFIGLAHCYGLSDSRLWVSSLLKVFDDAGQERGLRYLDAAKSQSVFCQADAQYYHAMVLRGGAGNSEEARKAFRALCEQYPGNLHYRTVLAGLERDLGDFKRSFELARSALSDSRIKDSPGIEVQALNTLMWSAYETGEYQISIESATQLQRMAKSIPQLDTVASWAILAEAESWEALGEHAKAVAKWGSIPPKYKPA